jgi:SAM-dependent methyltransferase
VHLAVPRPKHTKTRSHQPVPSPRCWCAAWPEPSSASLQFGSNTAPPKPIQRWSASDYAKNGRFVQEMAGAVFAMLASKPGERILDLGCGDGVLTTEIKATGADVLGVDLSDELLAVARMKGLRVRKLDGHALDFVSEFDAVFSNMALHWMRKPKLVIAGVYRALKPRGRFVAEFGGHGNVAAIATAMRAVGALRNGNPELVTPWFFPTVEEYGALLTEGGFTVKEIALVPRLTPLKTGIEGWLRTFGRSLFDQFAEPERTKVVGKVIELLRPSLCDSHGVWTADHVRVRFIAERGA